jgi:hypothetical protein
MAMVVRLSQTRWLSLEQVITVEDLGDSLTVLCAVTGQMNDGALEPLELSFKGDERLNLLAFLARNVSFTATHQK